VRAVARGPGHRPAGRPRATASTAPSAARSRGAASASCGRPWWCGRAPGDRSPVGGPCRRVRAAGPWWAVRP